MIEVVHKLAEIKANPAFINRRSRTCFHISRALLRALWVFYSTSPRLIVRCYYEITMCDVTEQYMQEMNIFVAGDG